MQPSLAFLRKWKVNILKLPCHCFKLTCDRYVTLLLLLYVLFLTNTNNIGVEDIQCDLDEKKVTVVCDDETDEQLMLAKLMKWSEASGKSVALASA